MVQLQLCQSKVEAWNCVNTVNVLPADATGRITKMRLAGRLRGQDTWSEKTYLLMKDSFKAS